MERNIHYQGRNFGSGLNRQGQYFSDLECYQGLICLTVHFHAYVESYNPKDILHHKQ